MKTLTKETRKKIIEFQSDFQNAKNEDWFEWLQDAMEIFSDVLAETK